MSIALGCLNLVSFIVAVYFYTKSQEETFDGDDDWENKYKKPLELAPDNFYYRTIKAKYKERFLFSASFLVALTDRYHRFQLFFKSLLILSIVTYQPLFYWWDLLIYFAVWSFTFTLTFRNGKKTRAV